VAGYFTCGDELSSSCATELVIKKYSIKHILPEQHYCDNGYNNTHIYKYYPIRPKSRNSQASYK
jgi:hypothetical protein